MSEFRVLLRFPKTAKLLRKCSRVCERTLEAIAGSHRKQFVAVVVVVVVAEVVPVGQKYNLEQSIFGFLVVSYLSILKKES